MNNHLKSKKHYTTIKPKSGWVSIDWKELIDYKDLLYFLVKREIKVLYKQTILGFSWAIIRPLFSMFVFTFIFSNLANFPSDNIPYPLFSYVALVPWTYFSSSLTKSTQSLISSKGMFTKVYFPRLIIPIVPVLSCLVDFVISFSLVLIFMVYYKINLSLNVVFIPFLIAIMIISASGVGMWLSALSIQYRDVKHGMGFLIQLLMYSAPVVWPLSLLKEKYGDLIIFLYGFYPMAGVIEGFRSCLIGQTPMPWRLIICGAFSALTFFIFGSYYFKRKEKYFADVA